MSKLYLGVIDGAHASGEGVTVAEVARSLEKEYGVVGIFWKLHGNDVIDLLLDEFKRDIKYGRDFTGKESMQKVKTMFSEYLLAQEHGIHTKAALLGLSSRHKSGEIGKPRQSFIDTGDYKGSFVGWIDA